MSEYNNPTPVAVAVVRVGKKLLGARRGTTPNIGELAFPAGYVEEFENYEQAASRELEEETGLKISPNSFRPLCTRTNSRNIVMVFMLADVVLSESDLLKFVPCEETQELVVIDRKTELCFPFHQEILESNLW